MKSKILELGREYYAVKIQDTYTLDLQTGSKSDYQDNGASREAHIKNDIEMRIHSKEKAS